jgi:glycosyltransferase involved in cell wall biosynthesis
MKIALLGPANSIHLKRWFHGLCARGYHVALISQHRDDTLDCPPTGSIHYLPHTGQKGYFLNAPALRRRLAAFRPDIVNAHYASGYGMLASLVRFRPTVLSVWGSDVYEFPYRRYPLNLWLMRWILKRNDQVASTSQAMAAQVRSLSPQVQNIAVTPFGVDTNLFSPSPQARDNGQITIGTVKTLERTYGIDTMIQAFARLRQSGDILTAGFRPKLQLVIVGRGSEREALVALTKNLGIDDCSTFVGSVSFEDVPKWLNRFDVYVAASRSESFGVAVIEASSCGVPVIVSDRGGLPEVVEADVTGFVTPAEDPDAIARCMKALVLDRSLRQQMGEAGRQRVMTVYGWSACIDRMVACYRTAIEANRSP